MAWVRTYTTKVDETVLVEGDTIAAADINNPQTDINGLQRIVETDSATAPTWSDIRCNATYDGSSYNRTDTSKGAGRIELDQYGYPFAQRVASGANPIIWTYSAFPFPGLVSNLMIRTASATTFAVSWDWIVLRDTTSLIYKVFPSGSVTITITNTGANGIDTGAMGASTLYYITIIGKADGTLAAVAHLASGTIHAPTFPSGYTFAWTVSWFYSNGSSQINPISQKGNRWHLEEGITAGIMRPVNASVPNSGNWQTANCSTWIPAGFGRMLVKFEGFLASASNDSRFLSIGDGGSTLSNSVNGHAISVRNNSINYVLGVYGEWALTDGTANQQIQWKFNAADATAAATLNILDAMIPTLMGG